MNGADIIALVAESWGTTSRVLTGRQQQHSITVPRHMAMVLIRDYLGYSMPQIGRLFGSRDHTSVLHGIRRCEELASKDAGLAGRIERLRAALDMIDFDGPKDKHMARAKADSIARALRASLMKWASEDPEGFLDRAHDLIAASRRRHEVTPCAP